MPQETTTQTGYALIVPVGVGITQAVAGPLVTNWSSQSLSTDWEASSVTASGSGGSGASG